VSLLIKVVKHIGRLFPKVVLCNVQIFTEFLARKRDLRQRARVEDSAADEFF